MKTEPEIRERLSAIEREAFELRSELTQLIIAKQMSGTPIGEFSLTNLGPDKFPLSELPEWRDELIRLARTEWACSVNEAHAIADLCEDQFDTLSPAEALIAFDWDSFLDKDDI